MLNDFSTSTLRSGGIPLISVHRSKKAVKLELTCNRRETVYFAISHVWADGLGNPHANALPQCQLLRLQSLVNGQSHSVSKQDNVPFWIDTLCVPTKPHEAQKMALNKMAETYQNAARVLVLDRGIQEISSAASKYETCLQILTSSWSRRTWTLQEGSLPTEISFILSDGIMTAKQIASLIKSSHQSVMPEILRRDFQNLYRNIRLGRDGDHNERLVYVWNALQWRSTSQKDDETLCIATMLGLDPSPLIDVPSHLRMQKLFSMRNEWPADVIFYPGKRVAEIGMRWMPDSFFERHIDRPRYLHTGVRTSKGLRFHGTSYSCLIMSGFKLNGLNENSYMVCEASEAAYDLRRKAKYQDHQFLTKSEDDNDEPVRYGLIMRNNLLPCQGTQGVLCRIDKQEEAIIFATYQALILCYRLLPELFDNLKDAARMERSFHVFGELAPEDTEWVVG